MQRAELTESREELRSLLSDVDRMWGRLEDSPLAGSVTALDQVTQLLLLQVVEAEDDRLVKAEENHKSVFESPVGTGEFRWSFLAQLSASEQYTALRDHIYPWLPTLRETNVAPTLLLQSPPLLTAAATLIGELVNALTAMDLPSRSQRLRGAAYEHLISKIKFESDEARKQGKYLTPRHLTTAIMRMLDVRPGETVLDPCCGTGGFLVAAKQHILESNTSPEMLEMGERSGLGPVGDLLTDIERTWMQSEFVKGADASREMARISCMNLFLHGIRSPDLRETDVTLQSYGHGSAAAVVATNPPFIKRDRSISDEFSLATRDTPDLIVQLALDLLWPGGRAAIVVPEGFLFSTQTRARVELRRRLVENNQIDGVVSLPAGAFLPSVGTKTSVLLVTKGGTTESVWMYDVGADGFTLDKKRQPTSKNDIPDLLAVWPGREETGKGFSVLASEIRENDYDLTVSRYVPFEAPDLAYQDASALATELNNISSQIHDRTAEVQRLIGIDLNADRGTVS